MKKTLKDGYYVYLMFDGMQKSYCHITKKEMKDICKDNGNKVGKVFVVKNGEMTTIYKRDDVL